MLAARRASSWPDLLGALCLALMVLVGTFPITTTAAPALPGEPCKVEPREVWTETESWVWERVCMGEIADLNGGFREELDPRDEGGWSERRRLSSAFLETILLHDPYRSAIPRQGVGIIGALFDEPIDLADAELPGLLALARSRFTAEVLLDRVRAHDPINFDGSVFTKNLGMNHAEMSWLVMDGAKVDGELDMDTARIAGDLWMRGGAEFNEVWLQDAKVGGWLELSNAQITNLLTLDSVSIGGNLFMDEDAEFDEISLRFADIGSNLNLSGATFDDLDLSGTHIAGELVLDGPEYGPPTWSEGARLTLRNVSVDAFQGEADAWPDEVDLDGFTYRHLGGESSPVDRGSQRYIDWLAKDEPFTPQPYEQLVGVLRTMGHGEEANDVLFAGRERARALALEDDHPLSWLGQTLLKWTIGYGLGYRYFYALFWVAGLILLGTLILRLSGQAKRPDGSTIGVWYSLDMLLPIIELRKWHHDNVDLEGFPRIYFYGHKMMGYVLASFLIAGLSGLTT